MCIIIHRPQGGEVSDTTLKSLMTSNPHGWGIMWAEEGRLQHRKSREMNKFWDAYDACEGMDVAIHFRWKTHGNIDDDNAHPYEVLSKDVHGRDLMLMHNGVIHNFKTVRPGMSDTWHYIDQTIRPYLLCAPEWYEDQEFWDYLKSDISGSRLLTMDHDGHVKRVGLWHESKGCWYSNTSYVSAGNGYSYNRNSGSYQWSNQQSGGGWRGHHTTNRPASDHYDDDFYDGYYFGGHSRRQPHQQARSPAIIIPQRKAEPTIVIGGDERAIEPTITIMGGKPDHIPQPSMVGETSRVPFAQRGPHGTPLERSSGGFVARQPEFGFGANDEVVDLTEENDFGDIEPDEEEVSRHPNQLDITYLASLHFSELIELTEDRPDEVGEILFDLMHGHIGQ